jgi:hypothetical protein
VGMALLAGFMSSLAWARSEPWRETTPFYSLLGMRMRLGSSGNRKPASLELAKDAGCGSISQSESEGCPRLLWPSG